MIERYSDHAANERTFLAWVRTAIAIMAFGFLVEKFDLFVEMAGTRGGHRAAVGGQTLANIAGLALIVLGCATLVLAIVRFRKTALEIDAPDKLPSFGERTDITLAGLLVLLGAAMFVYLAYTTISQV
jgi:putative membrane protein